MSTTYNAVVRGDPNRMVRVGRSMMMGAHVRGNQRPTYRRGKPDAPTLKLEAPPKNPHVVEWPEHATFVDDENSSVIILPESRTITRGDSVELRVTAPDAYDIEWIATSAAEHEPPRRVNAGRKRRVKDEPLVDTVYEVRYKRPVGRYPVTIVGDRHWLEVRVLDNPDNPASHLSFSLDNREQKDNLIAFWLAVESSNAASRNVVVQVELPENTIFDAAGSRRRTPAAHWVFDDTNRVGTCHIDTVEAGETRPICLCVCATIEGYGGTVHIERARAWSSNAPIAVGLKM